jgi:hypothetical protein
VVRGWEWLTVRVLTGDCVPQTMHSHECAIGISMSAIKEHGAGAPAF